MSDHIPQDLMANIFQRLSVKDLVKCRRVSKQWLAIIDDPHFISSKLQRSLSTNSNAALFLQERDSSRIYTYNNSSMTQYEPNQAVLMGSCHGLICFCLFNRPHDFVVVNPSTGERHTFTSTINEEEDDKLTAYGFGYDELSEDYKVVRIIRSVSKLGHYCYRAEICSLRAKGCSKTVPLLGWRGQPRKWTGVFVGGAVHWCTQSFSCSPLELQNYIPAIDLGSNTYSQLQLPDCCFGEKGFVYFDVGLVDRCLAICALSVDWTTISIWVMKEYGNFESWYMTYSIDSGDQVPHSVTSVGSNGSFTLLMFDFKSFVWCGPVKNGVGTVMTINNFNFRYRSFEAVYCLDSLVKIFPDHMAGDEEEDCHQKHHQNLAAQEKSADSNPYFLDLVNLESLYYDDYVEVDTLDEEY